MDMEEILKRLDPEQEMAVISCAPHILVVAPPGSGKTRVLAARFARLIDDGGPSGVIAVTFTNRAAREMRERISLLTGLGKNLQGIETFHSFCLKFLKESRPGLRLIPRWEQARILKDLGVKNPERALQRVSAFKNGVRPSDGFDAEEIAGYCGRLKELDALDFDDLILETIKILEAEPGALNKSRLMVDEYQDINPVQARLVRLISGSSALFAIGDPDQAIYSFRGASHAAFLDFEKDYPGAQIIRLAKNYRSGSKIVVSSSALIGNNAARIKNDAVHVREGGEIEAIEVQDEMAEAGFIIREIERMMGGLSSLTAGGDTGARFSDFAVLFRTNRQAAPLIEAFTRSSIPFHLVAPPGPGFSDFMGHLTGKEKAADAPLADFILSEGKAIGLDAETLDIFAGAAKDFEDKGGEGLNEFLEEMSLFEPQDNYDIKADKVNLMTLHMAKGLEFPAVFITGVEDGLMPLRLKGEDNGIEEERRLFYVGMTRAKDRLFLIHARTRRMWRGVEDAAASPFLKELPEGLVKRISLEKKAVKRRPVQKGLFE